MKFIVYAFLLTTVFATPVIAQDQISETTEEVTEEQSDVKVLSIEEEEAKIKEKKPQDKLDAVSGTVPLSEVPHYDLYERQIRYKKSDKEFRNSIEARRKSFIEPEHEHKRNYEKKLATIYAKEAEELEKTKAPKKDESASEQAKVDSANMPSAVTPKDERPHVPLGEPGDGMEAAPESLKEQEGVLTQASAPTASEEEEVGIKEIDVQETGVDGTTRKKIIVPEDAPEFGNNPFDEVEQERNQ